MAISLPIIAGILSLAAGEMNRAHADIEHLVNDNNGATGTGYFTQSEASLVVSGNNVVVGFNDSGAAGIPKYVGFAHSADGGMTFTDGGSLPTDPGGDYGDPVLARDENTGRIFLAALGDYGGDLRVKVLHSDDQGVTWSAPAIAIFYSYLNKPWMTVDSFPGPYSGYVYVAADGYDGQNGLRFARSTDGGQTFGSQLTITINGAGAFLATGPGSNLYAFWYDRTSSTLMTRKSTNGGASFSSPETIAGELSTDYPDGDLGLTGIRQGTVDPQPFRTNSFPHAAVNPVTGHIYVTYNAPVAGDKADVFMAMSTDGGTTWLPPVRVNDDVTLTDQWQPTVAVTPDGTWIGIFYYSRQNDAADNNLFEYFGRIGVISGENVEFLPSFVVSSTSSLPEFGRDVTISANYMGDYNTAVATDEAFHVVWGDNRDDLPGGAPRKDPNVYYKRIDVDVTSVPGGDRILVSRLSAPKPNPFQESTVLTVQQLEAGDVVLEIFNVAGARVRTLTSGRLSKGTHQLVWPGDDDRGRPLPRGAYAVRLSAGGAATYLKLVKTR